MAACSRPLSDVDAGGNGPLAGAGNRGGVAGAAGTPGGAGTAGGGGIGGGAGNAAGGAAATGGGAAARGGQGGFRTQCMDGVDNDGDGSIDYEDPECTSGGGDNDESTFAKGLIHEGDRFFVCSQDCFFDGNLSQGDDRCAWQLKCDPASVEASCPYDPLYAAENVDRCSLSASQPQTCLDACRKLVPNGCDCFGCCVVPGQTTPIRLATTCTAADFGDPAKCPPCTQVTQCLNPCDNCEFCIGKRALPDGCARSDGSAPYTCPPGSIACGATGIAPSACPAGTSCVTGCCLQTFDVL